jgi:hypothetical protein
LKDLYAKNSIEQIIFVAIEPLDHTHGPVLTRNRVSNVENYSNYLAWTVKPFVDEKL